MKHVLGYVCVPAGVVALVGGLHLSHDSTALGAATLAGAVALLVIAFRLLRVKAAE